MPQLPHPAAPAPILRVIVAAGIAKKRYRPRSLTNSICQNVYGIPQSPLHPIQTPLQLGH